MPKETPVLYGEFAKYYDRLEGQYRNYAREALWLESIFQKHNSTKIIDLSCGTANHLSSILNRGGKNNNSSRTYLAMDSSPQMIDLVRQSKKIEGVSILLADFLSLPFRREEIFDAAICMYWSLAGLDETRVERLFSQVGSILKQGGLFIFDVENSNGIKENLLNNTFIDAFFYDEKQNSWVMRANLSRKIRPDLVDWKSYYLIEKDGKTEILCDRMNLRFYSKRILENLLCKAGFEVLSVTPAPFEEIYAEHSSSLYFISQKKHVGRKS